MNISDFKRVVDKIRDNKNIIFTEHANRRILQRKIYKDEIVRLLDNFDGLLYVEFEKGTELQAPNYILVFKKFSNYDLVVVIELDGFNIVVITCYTQDKKKRDRYLKWLDSQK